MIRTARSAWPIGALAFVAVWLAAGCSGAGTQAEGSGGERRQIAPPDAPAFSEQLTRRLLEAYDGKGKAYVPRTRHLEEGGSARFVNRLILESSPYLLQHAHNPVNWYPWGEEAFADARRLGRPVLLSIGYSTCHWCHVMEEESFEDLEIAAYMNANYIPIKVDREERPDIDAIYMAAVQMLHGRGGWPMTSWLTPEGEPFFAGTYFPARDGDRGSRIGFLTRLRRLKEEYDRNPDMLAGQAKQIAQRVRNSMAARRGGPLPEERALIDAMSRYRGSFDPTHGGRKGRPKFPSSMSNRLLLSQYRRTGDRDLLEMASLTLTKMARGGMYDQVGGGFHRYSVDSRWLVPHFEKMLYDNALLVVAYLDAYQISGDEEFARVVREVLDYVGREMTAPGGGFYSATDADSRAPDGEMEEGWFFTWTAAEIDEVLDEENARRVKAYYGVTDRGNFEHGRTILNVPRPPEEVARMLGLSVEQLDEALAASREELYAERAKRPPPLRDEKVLTSWNGLMISAMARAGFVLDRQDYVKRASRAADFLLENMLRDGRLQRSFKDGRSRFNGYLDDYAFLIAGLLDLYEATSTLTWLEQAIALQQALDRHYRDPEHGGYFMTSDDHEDLLAREKPSYDGAEPSGNSVALLNLLRLNELTTEERYRQSAESFLRGFGALISRSPTAVSEMMLAVDFWLDEPKEIIIVTRGDRREAEPFLSVLRRTYLPNRVLAVVSEGKQAAAHSALVPLVQGKVARKGKTTAYVCEQGICQLPTSDVGEFERQLERKPPSTSGAGASE